MKVPTSSYKFLQVPTSSYKFLRLLVLSFILCIINSTSASSIEIINDRLYLWGDHRIDFGDYEYKLRNIVLEEVSPNNYSINSSSLTSVISGESLAVNTQVNIEDYSEYVKITLTAQFQQEHSFIRGFGAIVSGINMDRILGSNHAFEREYIASGRRKLDLLNNLSIKLRARNLFVNFFFPNPYHSYMVINPEENFIYLQILPEMKTRNSPTKVRPQEDIRHIVEEGNSVSYEFYIAKNRSHSYINGIIENIYFSPLPNSYTGGAVMMWDEIPMNFNERTFNTFTTRERTTDWTMLKMLELFEDFPDYKASILLSFDYVCPLWADDSRLDLSRGLDPIDIRGPFDLATFAPDSFKQWLYDIENSREYEWTNRTSLGFHALHHTYIDNGVILEQKYHEFDVYDSLEAVGAFNRVFSELEPLRITQESMKYLRYPGHKNSEAVLHETSRRGFTFTCLSSPHDYDLKDEFNISRVLTGRDNFIWTFKTASWTDVGVGAWEDIYRATINRVATGKPLLLGGHPNATFGMHEHQRDMVDTFYDYMDNLYSSTENFGFMLADSLTYLLEEFYNIGEIEYEFSNENLINLTINSNLSNNQTLVINNNFASQILSVEFNGYSIPFNRRENKTYITLPSRYSHNSQNVVSLFKTQDSSTLEQAAKQGINALQVERQLVITTPVRGNYTVNLYNIRGQTVSQNSFSGLSHTVNLNNLASGVYFAKVTLNNKPILKQRVLVVK